VPLAAADPDHFLTKKSIKSHMRLPLAGQW